MEELKRKTSEKGDNYSAVGSNYGENKKMDCLIVMDKISGLINRSNAFASFLTVAQKFKYLCIYLLYYLSRKFNMEINSVTNQSF